MIEHKQTAILDPASNYIEANGIVELNISEPCGVAPSIRFPVEDYEKLPNPVSRWRCDA